MESGQTDSKNVGDFGKIRIVENYNSSDVLFALFSFIKIYLKAKEDRGQIFFAVYLLLTVHSRRRIVFSFFEILDNYIYRKIAFFKQFGVSRNNKFTHKFSRDSARDST
jgi:hypothetical protein